VLLDVRLDFAAAISRLIPDRPDLIRACSDNPRRELIVQKLCAEIMVFERKYGRFNQSADLKRKRMMLIEDIAKFFINSVVIEHRNKAAAPIKSAIDQAKEKSDSARSFLGDSLIEENESVKKI
jgi:hypothetical protein